ncbi:hypothetical protein [Geopseudomonas aromaticivorans]
MGLATERENTEQESWLQRLGVKTVAIFGHGEEAKPHGMRNTLLAAALGAAMGASAFLAPVIMERLELSLGETAQVAHQEAYQPSWEKGTARIDPRPLHDVVSAGAQQTLETLSSELNKARLSDLAGKADHAWMATVHQVIEPLALSDSLKDRQAAAVLAEMAPELLQAAGAGYTPVQLVDRRWSDEYREGGVLKGSEHLSEGVRKQVERIEGMVNSGTADYVKPSWDLPAGTAGVTARNFVANHDAEIDDRAREFAAMEHLWRLAKTADLPRYGDGELVTLLDAQTAGPNAADYYAAFPRVREAGLAESLRQHGKSVHEILHQASRVAGASEVRTAGLASLSELGAERFDPAASSLNPLSTSVSGYARKEHRDLLENIAAQMKSAATTGFAFTAEAIPASASTLDALMMRAPDGPVGEPR